MVTLQRLFYDARLLRAENLRLHGINVKEEKGKFGSGVH
jgi:hypothetical protein